MGKKSLYSERVEPYLDQISEWVEGSIPEYKIYTNLGVTPTSWNQYKQQYPALARAIKAGHEAQIFKAEMKLLELIEGFTETEEKWERVWSEKHNKFMEIRTEKKKKKKAPSTEAIKFFLVNKAASDWRNKQDINFKPDTLEESLMGMDDEALRQLDKKLDESGDDA